MAEKNPFARFLSHFPSGKVLFREGDAGEDMYIIQSGRVAIKKRTGANKDVTLAVLEKGDFFGEMAVLERMPRSATAEMSEAGDLIVISGDTFGDMIKSNPEIAFRMLRKYSIRLREMVKQIETLGKQVVDSHPTNLGDTAIAILPVPVTPPAEALAYFISKASGNVFPVHKNEVLLGRFDSVTGTAPDVDLTNEDQARNISRRHARLVIKPNGFFIAEEIGTMNGTFVAGEKLDNNVLHPIKDGDELMLCRLALTFKGPQT
ncbi:MAG: cyclic nucleotide-binding domain-containing protein [Vicinamibacteria bacterium]|nr:cyclic nucleotide-binding domain-containing protein [Vicinamibacteria bacterium]